MSLSPLQVQQKHDGTGSTRIMQITGFTKDELRKLNLMDYRDMIDTVLDILDKRNNNLGTCWKCGYGVYTMWTDNMDMLVEIGKSCD